jgi:CxxC motif-containing protein
MAVIKRKTVDAPVTIGDILIENPAGVPCNIIATRNVYPA